MKPTREDMRKALHDYLPRYGGTVADLDSLDFMELCMDLEDRFPDAGLPEFPSDLKPPPPYETEDQLIDAAMASMSVPVEGSHQGENHA